MKAHIAVDIGGTKMRAALYSTTSIEPLKINRIKSHKKKQTPKDRLVKLIRSVWSDEVDISAIGVAAAGPIDHHHGIIRKSPNIPEFHEYHMKQHLCEVFGTPTLLGNDANLAALGEWKFGAGQNHDHLIYITISTGIGSGIITDGKLLIGATGMAAELGHTMVLPGGPVCSCGHRGHLEAISSGTAIAKWVTEEIASGTKSSLSDQLEISARKVSEAAQQGDPLALAAFDRAGKALGQSLADFLHIFNPTLIIFGGGVSKSLDLLLPTIETGIEKHIFAPGYLDEISFKTAELGDDAGLLGALALARSFEA